MSLALSIITAIHLASLSQIESGDNPKSIGKGGERTEFQISRSSAKNEFKMSLSALRKLPKANLDSKVKQVWDNRINGFINAHHVIPTPQQCYLLWNCPADALKPSPIESERAERFANLLGKLQKENSLQKN